ncbi:MAG: T9SS type A sorting domain-containing protein [Crocinitomicaceae bacterium]|nr:T9SS type A sorting domain-containing protein [Crocinitomicaceae bacterium]
MNTTPTNLSGLIQIPISINYNISCPGKIKSTPGSGGISGPKNQLTQEIADLKALIDGGNTQTLLNVIATNSPGQAKNALIAASPYLSDEVLLAYLASNPSSGHAQQVMIANSPLSADVLAAFNAKNYPGGIKKQVNANQNGISPMTLLQNEINALTSERKFYVDELIRYYLNDSTVVNPMDSIITILIEEGDRISKEQLCDALIIKGDLASATFVRAQFIAEYGESNFTDLAEININTRTEEDPILVVHSDSTMHATVTDIATDTSDPRMCPRGEATLFGYAYSQAFVHNIEELYLPGQSPKSMLSQDSVLSTETSQITIYPNPATNHLYVAFENFEQTENISVDIYNLVGQKINSLILTQNQQIVKIDLVEVPAGVYIVQIKDQNGILNVQKVVIERQ